MIAALRSPYTFIVSKRKSKGKICFNYLCCGYAICLFAVIVCYNTIKHNGNKLHSMKNAGIGAFRAVAKSTGQRTDE